jgi:uncharacterized protein DUF4203
MPNTLVILVTIVVGLISCFYGYPLVRILFAIIGLVAGYLIGVQLVPPDQGTLAIVIGVVVGLICAALAYPFWSIGITISGMVLGFGLFANLGTMLNLSSTPILILAVVGAIIVGALFFFARDPMIMLATAFSGASYTIYGLALAFPALDFKTNSILLAAAVLILGTIGFLVQYRMFKGRRVYSSVPAVES